MKGKKALIIVIITLAVMVIAVLAVLFAYIGYVNKPRSAGGAGVQSESSINNGMLYTVQDDKTDIYSAPEMSATLMMQCGKGDTVQFISLAKNGFYQVKINGNTGYVKADKLIDTTLATPAPAEPTAEPEQTVYVVNVENAVYLRKTPDMNAENLTTIPLGTAITLIKKENDDFGKVRYNGIEGFVLNKYLTTDAGVATSQLQNKANAQSMPAGSSSVTVKSRMYVVNVQNSIYLRTAPSDNATVITTIPVGSQVGYIDTVENGFYKISWNGQMGYSKAQYLSSNAPYQSSRTMVVSGVAHSVYLRENPSDNTRYITEIPVGAAVTFIADMGNGYYKVNYNGSVGYVTAAYLR